MRQTYKVHSVTEYEGDRRELLLTPVNLFDFVNLPDEDAPQWEQDAADTELERLEGEYGGEGFDIETPRREGRAEAFLATTTNPDIKPGQWLRFTVEVVSSPNRQTTP